MGITNSCFRQLKEVEKEESGECSGEGVEEEIECSKSHWSILDVVEGEEVAEVSNVEEFLALQRLPASGGFFATFYGEDENEHDMGELVVGEKFAEGGQAELYDCKVKWWYSKNTYVALLYGREYVLKVFKTGTYLKQLKSQLPQGLLQFHVEDVKLFESLVPIEIPRFYSNVIRGTLLKDGRFAFLMVKEHFDFRRLIDENMKLKSHNHRGPFSKEEVELTMYQVALGVNQLHSHNIVHRDLKASNVLVKENKVSWPKWIYSIADYECSIGVIGTGFIRAREILQACEERKLEERPEVFSKAADIYGFGMICYEVLTGKLPFEGRLGNDYNHVLSGHRPFVPKHAKDWICELLNKCWQLDPTARPSIGDVLSMILAHSKVARKADEDLKRRFGQHYINGYQARM